MKKYILLFAIALMTLPGIAPAQDLIVTRNFSGLWDQPQHESQGINLQIVDQASGEKVAVAYWYTYGDDMESSWFMGVGPVVGDQVQLTLYQASGIGFLESNSPGDDNVQAVGNMDISFTSCDDGLASFSTNVASVGSGNFAVERITGLFNMPCSGGISDDTPPTVNVTDERISLIPTRQGSLASGHADFEERADRTEFKVEAEDVPAGTYRIVVGGVDRGALVVSAATGQGETEFRSPVEPGKVLLTFDPRGQVIEVHDAQGAVLTSGSAVFGGGTGGNGGGDDDNGGGNGGGDDDNGGGNGGGDDDNGGGNGGGGDVEIEVDLNNTGVFGAASGDVRYRVRSDRTDFNVEIEDVPVGAYDFRVGGVSQGTIQAVNLVNGGVEGELEFRNPVEPGKILLQFDPRGQLIEILDGGTVIMQVQFPSN